MQTLQEGERGRLDPAFADGAVVAEASEYTGTAVQVAEREAVEVLGGVSEDPTGIMTVARAKTGASVQVALDAGRNELQTELRKLFTAYTHALGVPVARLYREGTLQVRRPHKAAFDHS